MELLLEAIYRNLFLFGMLNSKSREKAGTGKKKQDKKSTN
jgi:hypothetical protein